MEVTAHTTEIAQFAQDNRQARYDDHIWTPSMDDLLKKAKYHELTELTRVFNAQLKELPDGRGSHQLTERAVRMRYYDLGSNDRDLSHRISKLKSAMGVLKLVYEHELMPEGLECIMGEDCTLVAAVKELFNEPEVIRKDRHALLASIHTYKELVEIVFEDPYLFGEAVQLGKEFEAMLDDQENMLREFKRIRDDYLIEQNASALNSEKEKD
ncbi:MAG: hypothetical protein Q9214_005019 [Letrouitia sp. 1 TL-2023]